MNNSTKFLSVIAFLACFGACRQESITTPTTLPAQLAQSLSPNPDMASPTSARSISGEGLLSVSLSLPEGAAAWQLPTSHVRQIFYSPDGKYLGIVGSGVLIYEVSTLDMWGELPDSLDTNSATWAPDGQFIAGGSSNGIVSIWDISTNKQSASFVVNSKQISSLIWSPSGKLLAVVTEGVPRVWDASGEEFVKLDIGSNYYSPIAWSPNSNQLAGGSPQHGFITLWNTETGEKQLTIPSLPALTEESPWIAWVNAIAWSPDGRWLASGLGTNTTSGQSLVVIYDPINGEQHQVLISRTDPKQIHGIETDPGVYHAPYEIDAIAWSPNSELLVSGSYNGMVRVWKISEDRPVAELDNIGVAKSIIWSPDGKIIAISNYDGVLVLWDVSRLQ